MKQESLATWQRWGYRLLQSEWIRKLAQTEWGVRLQRYCRGLPRRMLRIQRSPKGRRCVMALAVLLFFLTVSAPLELGGQLILSGVLFLLALGLSRIPGHLPTLILIFLSITISTRYMYWRITETLGFETWMNVFLGTGLLLAEIYAFVVLLIGFFQTAWPLERRPYPLPANTEEWPTVDVFIPSYNEPLEVVKQTVFAAMAIDWPADKLKVYVLDDGRRQEFRDFCEAAGANYLIRNNNFHAKAGNINAALQITHGELISIFDCDHIPTRSFLQVAVGWFLKDPKLAMLQTPHVFFSPDPFEKNLNTFRSTPNEGELFYGLIQDGNDLWNATFFCGSCAVIRRKPLLEVGGIAVETVTEDAHTALKMSRLGYNTAYLAIPQAAGLATESLSGHVGQRIRWARGMAQIFRLDNPMLGPGLKLSQRLCYVNAMLHFFYGLPRIVFLTAPLSYLLLDAHVFEASAAMIAAYALPHIIHASLTNSRIQGQFRHSFWNEVYETVLAWYIMRPVLVAALIDPKLGKFNVTAKGGVIEKAYIDWGISRPYMVLLMLNFVGVMVGFWKMTGAEQHVVATIFINIIWTMFNILMCSASLAVASETRQLRRNHRVPADFKASIRLPNGRSVACRTKDFSQGGFGLLVPEQAEIPMNTPIEVSVFHDGYESVFPGQVTFRQGVEAGVQLNELSMADQAKLAQMTFSRADMWSRTWGINRVDRPLESLKEVLQVGFKGCGIMVYEIYNPVENWMRSFKKKIAGLWRFNTFKPRFAWRKTAPESK